MGLWAKGEPSFTAVSLPVTRLALYSVHLFIHSGMRLLLNLSELSDHPLIDLFIYSVRHLSASPLIHPSIPLFGGSVTKPAAIHRRIGTVFKALLFGSEEDKALTPIVSLPCARQGAGHLTRLIFALIPEASPKLPTCRRGRQAQSRCITCLETVNQCETEPGFLPGLPDSTARAFSTFCLTSLFAEHFHSLSILTRVLGEASCRPIAQVSTVWLREVEREAEDDKLLRTETELTLGFF